jgi:hypothetical protein
MITTMDKAWTAGFVTFIGQYLSTRSGWGWLTPELVAMVAGIATYWMPNKA